MTLRPPRANPPAAQPMGATARNLCLLASTLLVGNGLRQGGVAGLAQLAAGALVGWRGWQQHGASSLPVDAALASAVAVRSVSIAKPVAEVLAFCRQPANIGELLPWVDTLSQTAPGVYRWAVRGPGARTVHWDLQQHDTDDGDGLHWCTVAGSRWPVEVQASLRPTPSGKGTQLRVLLSAQPLPGKAGRAFSERLTTFADAALLALLQRIQQRLETGEAYPQSTEANDFLFVHPPGAE